MYAKDQLVGVWLHSFVWICELDQIQSYFLFGPTNYDQLHPTLTNYDQLQPTVTNFDQIQLTTDESNFCLTIQYVHRHQVYKDNIIQHAQHEKSCYMIRRYCFPHRCKLYGYGTPSVSFKVKCDSSLQQTYTQKTREYNTTGKQ